MDRRTKFRKGLSPIYALYYDALCDLMPPRWLPISGYRSFDQQAILYAQGRSLPGPIVSWAKAGFSAHNYGCASDWIVFEDRKPIWLEPGDPEWNVYFDAIEKCGLKSGKEFKDPCHNELSLSLTWGKILQHYRVGGTQLVEEKLRQFECV